MSEIPMQPPAPQRPPREMPQPTSQALYTGALHDGNAARRERDLLQQRLDQLNAYADELEAENGILQARLVELEMPANAPQTPPDDAVARFEAEGNSSPTERPATLSAPPESHWGQSDG